MNWKFRPGVYEQTGVSLKEPLPNNPIGGYTRGHQGTAQSHHRQRPHHRLPHAYWKDDVRLVRCTTALIDLLVHHVAVAGLCERWGLSPSCIYAWQKAFMLRSIDSPVCCLGVQA
jgi:hypothetical protein